MCVSVRPEHASRPVVTSTSEARSVGQLQATGPRDSRAPRQKRERGTRGATPGAAPARRRDTWATTIARPSRAAVASPRRPPRYRRARTSSGAGDARPDRANDAVDALRLRPEQGSRRQIACASPSWHGATRRRPQQARSFSSRTVSERDTGERRRRAAGRRPLSAAHAGRHGASWLCRPQQTTGIPSSDWPARSSDRPAGGLAGVYGSAITGALGRSQPQPARQVRVEHVEPAGAEPEGPGLC
jgi:hypothetical protein